MKHARGLEFVAINTSGSMNVAGWAHLVTYDTMYRMFEKNVVAEEVKKVSDATDEDPLIGYLKVDGKKIPLLAQKDPAKIPWRDYDVDVVIESTGKFTKEKDAKKHAMVVQKG